MSKVPFHKGVYRVIIDALNNINELRFVKVVQNDSYQNYSTISEVSL